MDTPDRPGGQDLAVVVAALTKQIEALDRTPEDLIDFDHIESTTGIPADAVGRLFAGEAVTADELNHSFPERLKFLRRTRLRDDGKQYSGEQLARRVGIAKPTMSALIRGDRKPNLDVNRELERIFHVSPGFFTMSGEEALVKALERVSDQVLVLSQLKGVQIQHMALRGSIAAGDDELAQELRAALISGLAPPPPASEPQPEDCELRELTDTMRALPAGRRHSVMNVVRGVLGLAHDEAPEGANSPKR
ncbi:helix-turn-helix domain-containing protein [Streptomyces sp. NBC_01433]|uniref:helix-turn-helix domain-containing protein n=1 Tax=Streptomyces sp. NBC_01433 TaxID=2903864 RepID=UPI002252C722|nr:helix-turn-helix transcriptional regulator [Streptomyces sp. NBC_01433]MCX4681617.1 helix-turn-helix domain-containing protein [Streptomyces sp. NBC_01433]